MNFTSLKDFRQLREAIKCCGCYDSMDIGCEKCPLFNIDDCLDYIAKGERAAIDFAIKYLEKQEKRKRKHG